MNNKINTLYKTFNPQHLCFYLKHMSKRVDRKLAERNMIHFFPEKIFVVQHNFYIEAITIIIST